MLLTAFLISGTPINELMEAGTAWESSDVGSNPFFRVESTATIGYQDISSVENWAVYGEDIVDENGDLTDSKSVREEVKALVISITWAVLTTAEKQVASKWFACTKANRDSIYTTAQQTQHAEDIIPKLFGIATKRGKEAMAAVFSSSDLSVIDDYVAKRYTFYEDAKTKYLQFDMTGPNPVLTSDTGIVTVAGNSYFSGVDVAGGIDISASWTDITLDTEHVKSGMTHAADSAEVTIDTTGVYVITYYYTVEATNDTDVSAEGRLMLDTGAGYTEVSGTRTWAMGLDQGQGSTGSIDKQTAGATIILSLTATDKLKIQAERLTSAFNTVMTLADGCGLTIHSL